jgi:NAD(P)-dependent dehydrogenase (short-subunit alcohol dehydrogenase family)
MAVNAGGTFECIKAAGAVMTKAGRGKIVNVASSTFFKGAERMGHYAASKGAVIGLTRSVARELGEYGITVNCIAPGLTITPQLQGVDGFSGPRLDAAIASRALKRGQSPQDLLGAMLFFCSAESDFITGQTLVVDGGGVMQ